MEKDIKIAYNLSYENQFDVEDLKNRRLYINCVITEDMVDSISYQILRYNFLDMGIPVSERKPIFIYINSVGGSMTDGLGIMDAIIESKTPVYTVNIALCASMALYIFMAGHFRYSFKHSTFLLHEGTSGAFDSSSKLKDRLEFESEQMEPMIKQFVINNSKISSNVYDKNFRKEWYFLPEEGKQLGIVDYIVGVDCTIDDIVHAR